MRSSTMAKSGWSIRSTGRRSRTRWRLGSRRGSCSCLIGTTGTAPRSRGGSGSAPAGPGLGARLAVRGDPRRADSALAGDGALVAREEGADRRRGSRRQPDAHRRRAAGGDAPLPAALAAELAARLRAGAPAARPRPRRSTDRRRPKRSETAYARCPPGPAAGALGPARRGAGLRTARRLAQPTVGVNRSSDRGTARGERGSQRRASASATRFAARLDRPPRDRPRHRHSRSPL